MMQSPEGDEKAMSKPMNLNFNSTTLDRYGLPDITYLIPIMNIQAAMAAVWLAAGWLRRRPFMADFGTCHGSPLRVDLPG